MSTPNQRTIHIIFDGPPGPEAGRFVEVENDKGESIRAGEWLERKDGLWELVIPAQMTKAQEEQQDQERQVELDKIVEEDDFTPWEDVKAELEKGLQGAEEVAPVTPFSLENPPPRYAGMCVQCSLTGEGPDKMGECIVCYPCLNMVARQSLHKAEKEQRRWYLAYRNEVDAYITLFGRLCKVEEELEEWRDGTMQDEILAMENTIDNYRLTERLRKADLD